SVWGSDAIGAVINIFTRRASKEELSLETTVGNLNYRSGQINLGFGDDQLSNSLSLSGQSSDGFDVFDAPNDPFAVPEPDSDGYRRIALSWLGDYRLSNNGTLDWILLLDQGNTEFDSSFGGNESDYDNQLIGLSYRYNHQQWNSEISIRQNEENLINYGNGFTRDTGTFFNSTRTQINAHVGYQINADWAIQAGVEQYNDDVSSATVFVEERRTTQAAYLLTTGNFGDLSTQLSVRHDDVKDLDSDSTFNLSLGYQLNNGLKAIISRGKGFRAPSFNDLFFPDSAFFGGNPNLESESAFTNEFTLKQMLGNHELLFSYYDTEFTNLINFELDANFVLRPFNVDRAEIDGYELIYRYQSANINHQFSYSYVDPQAVVVDPVTGNQSKDDLIRRVNHSFDYQLTWQLDDWQLMFQALRNSERPDDDFATFPATRVNLPSYNQFNVTASYQFSSQLTLRAKLNDLTDEAPVQVLNFRSPGRQSFLTLQYNFQ
ncbi:MAG: TonB-dependent receptor, partial [Kangiellaceae bacterium]|nr:TonB-dependent receptor [Kangiellaceae bacterium]